MPAGRRVRVPEGRGLGYDTAQAAFEADIVQFGQQPGEYRLDRLTQRTATWDLVSDNGVIIGGLRFTNDFGWGLDQAWFCFFE